MSPIEYVLHPDTEIISLAIKYGDEQTQVIFGEDSIREHLQAQDWSDVMLVAHNMSAFDAMIFAWRFKVKPKVWGCTLAMARPIHSKTTGNSLAKLVEHYKLGVKDNTALLNTKGRHLVDFTAEEINAMRVYNRDDTDQCHALFKVLLPHYNSVELWQIDTTIRMLVEPQIMLDRYVLDKALSDVRIQKQQSLAQMASVLYEMDTDDNPEVEEVVRSKLASTAQFKKLLQARGVDVPMKPSPTNPDIKIPALSKTDEEFLALQEHEDPVVALAASTRLEVKSTILQTRLESFIATGKALRGRLPIPLHYCGADTTGRWSGFMYNPQNLPRIDPSKPKLADALRKSMVAPPGYKIVVADLSGIELRVNHFLWKVPSSMALYKTSPDKADLYRDFAAKLYNVAPEAVTKAQRQVGKVAHLGLGFGAGAATFQKVAKLMGGVDLTTEEAEKITYRWRDEYGEIVDGWRICHSMLHEIEGGGRYKVDPWGLVITEKGALVLPSGRRIRYPNLERETDSNGREEWWYGAGRNRARIYAGKIDENCIAEGTLVLTDSGWKPIETVKRTDMVHDGVEFVRHDGVVFKSVQSCVTVDGVYMTPDHEVLTDEGWQEASQVQSYRNWQDNTVQPDSERVAGRQVDGSAVVSKPVYDILNCGPRSRFVVNGDTAPFIVHNCVQALARDVIAGNAYEVFKQLKIRPSLTVHDELVYVVPEEEAQHVMNTVHEIMRTPPAWWPELITWSEGDIAGSYGEAK